ncbi:MAG: hypothetical protein ACLRZ9_00705 [Eubacterium sp.]
MINFKNINEVHTPETWICETLEQTQNQEKKHIKYKKRGVKKLGIAVCAVICCIMSLSVAATVSDNFRDWIKSQIQRGKRVDKENIRISKVELPKEWDDIRNGFIIVNEGTKKETTYCVEKGRIKKNERKHAGGKIEAGGKTYEFSFDYEQQGQKIHGYNYTGVIMDVAGYVNKDNCVLLWLVPQKISELYYMNLTTGELNPAVDETQLEEILAEKLKIPDKTKIDYLHYAIEAQISPDGKYILFRSNRNYFLADQWKGEYDKTDEEWFVKNTVTGEETKIEGAPGYLLDNEIGFVDNIHISLCDETGEKAGVYNCEKKQLTWSEEFKGISFGNTMIYVDYDKEGFKVRDELLKKTSFIPADSSWKECGGYWNRNVVCLFHGDEKAACKVYLVKQNKVLDFEHKDFADVDVITDVFGMGEDTYLFIGKKENKKTGYLLELK